MTASWASLGFVESAAEKQSPLLRKDLDDPEKREDFIDKLVNMELLAAEAAEGLVDGG